MAKDMGQFMEEETWMANTHNMIVNHISNHGTTNFKGEIFFNQEDGNF